MHRILVINLTALPKMEIGKDFWDKCLSTEKKPHLIVIIRGMDDYLYRYNIEQIQDLHHLQNLPLIIISPGLVTMENAPSDWENQNYSFDLFQNNKVSSDVLFLWEDHFLINDLDGNNHKLPGELISKSGHKLYEMMIIKPGIIILSSYSNEFQENKIIQIESEPEYFGNLIEWDSKDSHITRLKASRETISLHLKNFEQILGIEQQISGKDFLSLDIKIDPEYFNQENHFFLLKNYIENTIRHNKSIQINIQ